MGQLSGRDAMRRLIALAFLLLFPTSGMADALRPTAHITSQTTTTLVAAVAGKQVQVNAGSLCVDGTGAATGVTLQSTAGTNIVGTGIVWVLNPGQCLWFQRAGGGGAQLYGQPTAVGTGLQIVTTVGNGPLEVYLEVVQQ